MQTLFRAALDGSLLKPDGGTFAVPGSATSMCRLATGRSALFHLIQRLADMHAAAVLMPAYVAEGVVQPFLNAKFDILFYRLQPDLRPRLDDVAALLGKVDRNAVFVLVHYFGFSARSAALSALLAEHHPVIVEDCAHALFTTAADGRPLAEDAELSLFSLNKFLPVMDGALLFSTRRDIDLNMHEGDLPELPAAAKDAYLRHLRAGRDLLACDDPTVARYLLEDLGGSYERYYLHINTDLGPRRQSDEARRVESLFPCSSLITQRVSNSLVVYRDLRSSVISPVFPGLPAGVVPFCIPARVPAEDRTGILTRLFERGILLSTLQDKWDFLPSNRAAHYAVERAFLDEHVLIPVNEHISSSAMEHMIGEVNKI